VFARQGGVYGQSKLETTGFWEVPNLFTYENYDIPSEVLEKWIEENDLDAIIFNEEYDWRLIRACKNKGIKVLTYLDYYKDDWKSNMKLYDGALCSTKRTYNLIEKWCKAYYIGWGIDTELFKPAPIENKEYTFFHNAGWLGINYRKMTPAVILAFDAISKTDKNLSLLVHSQVEMEKLPDSVAKIVRENPKIDFRVQTVGSPGLYHLGKIYVYPTKLEGLGLTVIEALSCGLPVITTDAPPMNEFVKDSYNGLLVKVAKRITRQDVIAFPEELVDLNDLAMGMYQLAKNAKLTEEMSQNARRDIEQNYNWNKKKEKIIELVSSIINK
jgi:glycosyltransferase involved in cell wall biosynthesis